MPSKFEIHILPILVSDRFARACRAITKHQQDAEDLATDTAVWALRYVDSFEYRSDAATYAWVHLIARHRWFNKLAKRRSARVAEDRFSGRSGAQSWTCKNEHGWLKWDKEVAETVDMEGALDRKRAWSKVKRSLDGLHPTCKGALQRRYLDDMDTRETAEDLGVAPGTVMSALYRGIRKVRKAVGAPVEPTALREI